ncbi:hypothetical protein RMCBS344292_01515 [Rhizopus microsporus]|nr:hypothetical protein RMCBS344292_01515 [Rhizopus microsporus]
MMTKEEKQNVTPIVTLNGDDHPLTTEEPFHSDELEKKFKDMNLPHPEDKKIPPAVIIEKEDPNKLILPGPVPNVAKPNEEDEEEDVMDDELYRITESNRYIPYEEILPPPILGRVKSLRSQDVDIRRHLLVFADKPSVTKKSDRIIVRNLYGAGPDGKLADNLKPKRKQRSYLVACDFSDESFNAIEWTMGTMMRDGDHLHIVTAVNREDNPDTVKQAGLSLSKELDKASEAVTEEAKKTLGQMLLFDVTLTTYAICGRVKDVLTQLITELSLTMVVCGSRGRGTMKGLFMGSVSTYLVHKSPVPVTVIKPQKKKKAAEKKKVKAAPLSESMQTGQLAVDELSTKAAK